MDAETTVTPLITNRLILRGITPADLDVIATMQTDPVVMEHYGNGRPLSRADAEATVMTYHVRCREHDYWAWAVTVAETGEVLGQVTAGWDPFDESRAVALGYILKRSAWGFGYGAEAVSAVVRHGLDELGWPIVWASVSPQNRPSLRLCEKVGLTPAGERMNSRGMMRPVFRAVPTRA